MEGWVALIVLLWDWSLIFGIIFTYPLVSTVLSNGIIYFALVTIASFVP
jgi:hypothetical protein